MSNLFVIEARVKQVGLPTVFKYLGLTADMNPINPEWAKKSKVIFSRSLNDAYFFTNLIEAQQHYDALVATAVEPNTSGKTMFVPPISEIIGGEHGNRRVRLELVLVNIVGHGLVGSNISPMFEVELLAEELVGQPYSIQTMTKVNLLTEDNHLGEYNITPPVMEQGDTYYGTRIDFVNGHVIHEAFDGAGRAVHYTCTKLGNRLGRNVGM